jgi:hypothetical protein
MRFEAVLFSCSACGRVDLFFKYGDHPRYNKRRHSLAKENTLNADEDQTIVHLNYRDSTHFIEKLKRYTSVAANQMFGKKFAPGWGSLLKSAGKEFLFRFVKNAAHKNGFRGFALSMLMIFYRINSHVKLWGIRECAERGSPAEIYEDIRGLIIE